MVRVRLEAADGGFVADVLVPLQGMPQIILYEARAFLARLGLGTRQRVPVVYSEGVLWTVPPDSPADPSPRAAGDRCLSGGMV